MSRCSHSVCFMLLFCFTILVGCSCSSTVETGETSNNQAENKTGGNTDSKNGTETEDEFAKWAQDDTATYEVEVTKHAMPKSIEEAKKTIDAMSKMYRNVPQVKQAPYNKEEMVEYAKSIKFLMEQSQEDIKYLKKIEGNKIPGATKITAQFVDNPKKPLLERLENDATAQYGLQKDIAHSLKYTKENLHGSIKNDIKLMKLGAEIDINDKYKVINNLTSENILKLRENTIPRAFHLLNIAIQLDQTMGKKDSPWKAKKKEFIDIVKTYRKKVYSATSSIMPPKDIGNSQLKAVAEEALKAKKITFERVIVNNPKKNKNRVVFSFDSEYIIKSTYQWEEFQVATIEKKEDKFYIYYNTILKYSKGPNTVPVNKWVLGERFKSTPIVKENINK